VFERRRDLWITFGVVVLVMLLMAMLPVIFANWMGVAQVREQVQGIEQELNKVRERVQRLERRKEPQVEPLPPEPPIPSPSPPTTEPYVPKGPTPRQAP
jgi:hypothetical protein